MIVKEKDVAQSGNSPAAISTDNRACIDRTPFNSRMVGKCSLDMVTSECEIYIEALADSSRSLSSTRFGPGRACRHRYETLHGAPLLRCQIPKFRYVAYNTHPRYGVISQTASRETGAKFVIVAMIAARRATMSSSASPG